MVVVRRSAPIFKANIPFSKQEARLFSGGKPDRKRISCTFWCVWGRQI
ncbi:hypothetical protein HMPREF1326_01166 [Akkermansia sp. KLE1605]|nr:hypothetical protein HMPREF1326_01166 [Akkermansia sp. KLE1605]